MFANEYLVMAKTILCAIDLSEASNHVVSVASKMASNLKEHLTVLFSYRLNQSINEADVFLNKREVEEKAMAKFKSFEVDFLMSGLTSYEFRSEVGFLSDRLDSYSKKNDIDILIIGQHLAQGSNDLRGSGLDNFLNKLQIPVLVVPETITG